LSPELRDIERWLAAGYPALASREILAVSARAQANPVTSGLDPWLRSAALLSELLAGNLGAGAGAVAEEVLRDLQLGPHRSWADESLLIALLVLIYVDECETAAAWCARLAGGSPTWQALIAGAMAEIAVRQGDLAAAVRQARLALTHLPSKAWGVAAGLPLGSLILAATRMGDYDSVAKFLAYTVPKSMFSSRYGLHYLYARGHYHLATNHRQAALADFMSCGELMRGWGLDIPGLVLWRTAAAEAWLRLGNKDQARVLISDQLARPGIDDSRARASALRLLATTRQPNRQPQLLTEALEIFESRGDRFEQARVLADLSHAYNALGKKRRARLMFRRAAHVADMCGAKPLHQDLLAVSDDAPGDVPAPGRNRAIGSLTHSERRVASLAVMGYTNREIAAKLFITASTVEQHLTRVYRKLDVKRRKDLPIELWFELTRKRLTAEDRA
jgi:DNA-binding CsgD family transcriptional regulator